MFAFLFAASLLAVPAVAQTPLPDDEKAVRAIRAEGGSFNFRIPSWELRALPPEVNRGNYVVLRSRSPADQLALLKHFKHLKTVVLEDVALHELSLEPLAQCKELAVVLVVSGRLTPRQVQDIAAVKTLRIVQLRCSSLSDEALAKLAAADTLEDVALDADALTGSGLKNWGRLKRLRVLTLDCAALDEAALAHLLDLEALEELTLFRPDLTAAGIQQLKKLKKLRRLTLVCPELTDAGLKRLGELKDLKELESLSIRARSVSKEAVGELQKALPPTKPARFRLWEVHQLGSLYQSDVPNSVLEKLQANQQLQREFETRAQFRDELGKTLTKEDLVAYEPTLLHYAEKRQERVTVERWFAYMYGKRVPINPNDNRETALLKERYNAAQSEIRALYQQIQVTSELPDVILNASLRLLIAARELDPAPAKQVRALEDYVELLREVEKMFNARYESGKISVSDVEFVRYHRADAELQLLRYQRQLEVDKPGKDR